MGETSNKRVAWNKGLPCSDERKLQLSLANKKYYSNPVSREKVSEATRLAMQNPIVKAKLRAPRTIEVRKKNSEARILQWRDESYREKMINAHRGNKPSDSTKTKMRQAALQRIIKNGTVINIGKNETEWLDYYEVKDKCKIKRGYNIKALGYVVDGFCEETNTVYEVYESFHNKQIFEDLKREEEICRLLNCDFIIIYDTKGSAF